jgi:hypothetical protein
MRRFGPSAIAFVAAVVWLGVWTIMLPASDDERVLPVAKATTLEGPCSTAVMVARLPDVDEASGLAISRRSPDLLWTHNDSGPPVLYAFGTDGSRRGRVRVTGARLDNWEGLASGGCPDGACLYIADIGDNKASRRAITVYRVPEPAPSDAATKPAVAMHASYPEGPQDAEGLFIGPDGTLHVVTKGDGVPISIYRFPAWSSGSTVRLERVTTLAGAARKEQRVTDAETTPDGQWIALRTLETVAFHRAAALLAGKADAAIEVGVTKAGEPQGEGIAMTSDGTVYLAGEAGDGVRGGTLARLSCKLP